jgi:hypothetical protein
MGNENKRSNYRALIPINKCALCDITAKETKPSFIEVDHKDTDHSNNEVSNLWALCKFCHNMKTKYEHHFEEETFWAIAIATLPENDERKSIQRFDKKRNVVHIPMTIKEFIYETSLDYFKNNETLKEHYVIVNLFEETLVEIKYKYQKEIRKKKDKHIHSHLTKIKKEFDDGAWN